MYGIQAAVTHRIPFGDHPLNWNDTEKISLPEDVRKMAGRVLGLGKDANLLLLLLIVLVLLMLVL